MKKLLCTLLLALSFCGLSAQERRPIDNQHPLWLVHIDVWNSADPQKIIDLIPDDIKPYVCMNLSLSCQFDTATKMYRMPRNAVRTYRSWASVCQKNNMWFTCQPASGGHTHIQDSDLETFEYFFKAYPNFLGWNYAEQFWAFGDANDESSMTDTSRWALFAKLVEMSHKYGGFLTVSWCGGVYHMNTSPLAELKRNKDFLAACKNYPESILFLYKYTHASSFYNNESVCWGPFVSGLTKNYGVRYDNCGWNDTMAKLVGENRCKYPGAAGIATVMEQTCVNGGAVWDGPELIWTEDFQNLSDTRVDGYTRRNWGLFPNFKGIWLDMWRKIMDGTMYIPSREEVVAKTKVVVINDKTDDYTTWDDLYNGLYLQTDPANQKKEGAWNYGQWQNNLCYFKSTGRYGAIPMVIGLYDEAAKSIPVQVKKSAYTSRWGTQAKKVEDFDAQYPEVSTGDLYVNRYRNQLVTYTPYTYLNKKTTAQASIPLQYNTCQTLELKYAKLSSGIIREYSDHIDVYLNNFRNDTTTIRKDTIIVTGVTSQPSYKLTKHDSYTATVTPSYKADEQTYHLIVTHLGPLDLTINCQGDVNRADIQSTAIPMQALPQPKQPEPFNGRVVIEAEDMDFKNVNVCRTHSGWWAKEYNEFAGLGYVEMGTNTAAALRHQLKLDTAGDYDIFIRYCNTKKAGSLQVSVNGQAQTFTVGKVDINDWQKLKVSASLNAGANDLVITNTGGTSMVIDQIIYSPKNLPAEKFLITIREAEHGTVTADVSEAAEGQVVTLTAHPNAGCQLKELRIINSVYFTMAKTIAVGSNPDEITFTMPEDNVTIQPIFTDTSMVYDLEFTNVLNGTIPKGWRCTQENNEVHEYPNSYGSGSRTFNGFAGYQGAGLYWRNGKAEYGKQSAYPLTLEPGDYKLTFAMAAWKGAPTYKAEIIDSQTNKVIASSATLTAAPNVEGNTAASIASAVSRTLPFTLTNKTKCIIRFSEAVSGYTEYLLLQCRINNVTTDGIAAPNNNRRLLPVGIYAPDGRKIGSLQRGLNIVVDSDGSTRKVMLK